MDAKIRKWLEDVPHHSGDADAMAALRKLAEIGLSPDVGYSKHPENKGKDWYCDLDQPYSDQIGANGPAEAIFAATLEYLEGGSGALANVTRKRE